MVLGHADYYPRFGFSAAAERDLRCEFPSPPESFLAIELEPGALDGVTGTVRYHPAFGAPSPESSSELSPLHGPAGRARLSPTR